MNISREKIDDLNEVIKLKIDADDYTEKVESTLKDYKKKARIDGFRPGMVPMGLVKKLYYKPVLADEINKIVSENLMTYIREEKLRILGEPLPHKDTEKEIDFDNETEFEFSFDIGLYPEFSASISEKDSIVFYEITVDEKAVEDTISEVSKRYGELAPAEEATDNEYLKGVIYQSDDSGTQVENGISVEDAAISLEVMKDDKIKEQFKGAKVGQKITFDLKKAYPSDIEISSLLKIKKEDVGEMQGMFTFEINEIQVFKEHELNQELFDKVYGEGQVHSMEEFREKVKEELTVNYRRESEYRFSIDAKDYFLQKAKIELPLEFLKRWLVEANENITAEQVEKDLADYEDDFKWQIIKDQIIKENEIKTSEEELFEYSRVLTRNQFYGYGMYNIPEDYLDNYAREQLAKKETARKIYDQVMEQKAFQHIQEAVKLDKKETTMEKFRQLFEK